MRYSLDTIKDPRFYVHDRVVLLLLDEIAGWLQERGVGGIKVLVTNE
jgi:hypothetical protein